MKLLIPILIILLLTSCGVNAAVTYTAGNLMINVSGSETMGTIYAADVAGGWGVVLNPFTNVYTCAAGINIADLGTLTIDSQHIYMANQTTGFVNNYYYRLNATGTLDIDNSEISVATWTTGGVTGIAPFAFGNSVTTAVVNINNSKFTIKHTGGYGSIFMQVNVNVKNVIIDFQGQVFYNTNFTIDGINSFIGHGTTRNVLWYSSNNTKTFSFTDDCENYCENFFSLIDVQAAGETSPRYLKNIYLKDSTYLGIVTSAKSHYIVNLTLENVTNRNGSSGNLYIAWLYDPIHIDSSGNLLNGATVTLSNSVSGTGTTGADGKMGASIINKEGYWASATGTTLQGTGADALVVNPASGATMTLNFDLQADWKGYTVVQALDSIESPVHNTYSGSAGDTISVTLPSITGATINVDVMVDDGALVVSDVMTEVTTEIYVYEWNTTGRTDGENFIIKCTDSTNTKIYTYNAELRASGGLTGDQALQLTSIDNDTVNVNLIKIQVNKMNFNPDGGILTDTDEIALEATNLNIKTQTDKMNFNPSGEILTDTDEIALETTVTTYANYKADVTLLALESTVGAYVNYKADVSGLATTAALTDIDTDVNLILGSTEIMFHYLIGNQQINALGYHQFFKVDSSVLNKRYQLLDVDGNITTSTLNAYGREDNTP